MGAEEFRVEVAGGHLRVRRQGRGPALVLCHGGPGIADNLGALAELVEDRVTVFRFDQRGSGGSTRAGPIDVEALLRDLEALRAHIGAATWIVAGHSWGANLALAYASRVPQRVRAVIYLSGTGIDPQWQEEARIRRLSRLARRDPQALRSFADHAAAGVGASDAEVVRHAIARKRLLHPTEFADPGRAAEHPFNEDVDLEVNKRLWRSWHRLSADPSLPRAITAPVHLIHGDRDPRPLFYVEELAASLTDASLTVLRGVGHYAWVEDPERLRGALRAGLRRGRDPLDVGARAAERGPLGSSRSFAASLAEKYERPQGTPWDIGRPQRALLELAASGEVGGEAGGRLLDVGCGAGDNAAALAQGGAEVVGVDISPAAVAQARARAPGVRFVCADVLALGPEPSSPIEGGFTWAVDSGFFHNLSDEERGRYVEVLGSLLEPGARLFLLAVSDEEPGSWGPRRVSSAALTGAFGAGWEILSLRRSVYESRVRPEGAAALFATILRRPAYRPADPPADPPADASSTPSP